MHLPVCLLLTIAALSVVGAEPVKDVDVVEEPKSGHQYPATLQSTLRTMDANGEETALPRDLTLLGLSIKETSILRKSVYSCALYADATFTEEELEPLTGPNTEALGEAGLIYEKLLQPNAVKELRLRFCREVDAEDFIEDFDGALESRIQWWRVALGGILVVPLGGSLVENEPTDELETLTAYFPPREFEKNHELRFTWHPDGTLSTVVNGERKPDLKAPGLAWALFDAYLGEDPVSSAGKRSLVARVGLIEPVMIRVVRLTIPDGSRWKEEAEDPAGEPDLFVQLFQDGRKIAESTTESGWKVDFAREKANFWTVRPGASYRLKVYDSDLLLDDLVGEIVDLTIDDFMKEDGRILDDPDSLNPRACSAVHVEVVKQ